MHTQPSVLLALISNELKTYSHIPTEEKVKRAEKKQFIYGLMTAARVFGIERESLNTLIEAMPPTQFKTMDEKLEVPTYIRNEITIEF